MDTLISDTQVHILTLLGRFKFLVISQIVPLIQKSTGYTRQQLASLAGRGYIKSHQLSKPIKAEGMYYLTEAGKELIIQHAKTFDDDLRLPIGVPLLVKDYPHRRSMISLTIALYYHITGLGVSITDMISYFDKQGENRKSASLEAKTKIPIGNGFFIPDGILLTEHENNKKLFLLEMYCDLSSTRVIDQIVNKHMISVAEGSPGIKFGIHANPLILSAFEHDTIKDKVIERLQSNESFTKHFQHLFFFGTLSEIKKDCGNAWQTILGEKLVF